jgi:hypothetical protein
MKWPRCSTQGVRRGQIATPGWFFVEKRRLNVYVPRTMNRLSRASMVLIAISTLSCAISSEDSPPLADHDRDVSVASGTELSPDESQARGVADRLCVPRPPAGRWTTGDLHVHTIESNDAQVALSRVLDDAFDKYHLDWVALSNHLRVSNRDHEGNTIASGPVAMSRGIALYEQPTIVAMQAAGRYADKTVFSSVEWDMPTHEHFNVGIVSDAPQSAEAIKALNEFEYLFTNRDSLMFDPADVARWGDQRAFSSHGDALKALAWLKANYPRTSYGIINHPFRYPDKYKVSNFREFNDLAPNIVFTIEGMIGNQMEPDRGGYASARIDANAHARTYGGADSIVAKLGGIWDSLLGEGRRIWNVGNSDFHFKTAGGLYSSGYFPGEYTKNYVWVEGRGMPAVLAGLRSGKAFAVTGNLISALDFTLSGPWTKAAEMGGELRVHKNAKVRITIRWKSELPSNYETPIGSGNVPGAIPTLDHVDLIAGDVTTKAAPGTAEYDNATNPSTHVVARFSAANAVKDAHGYNVITYKTTATKNQYFRLRGTNLGVDVAGETQNGEPLADPKTDIADNEARFNAINDRNYADLWFYSNPIFMKID